jgi:hypothetical protein
LVLRRLFLFVFGSTRVWCQGLILPCR